jgi:hypothetical protein
MKAERKNKIQVAAILIATCLPLWGGGGIAELHAQTGEATYPPTYLSSLPASSGDETLPSAATLADSRQSFYPADFPFDREERSTLGAPGKESGGSSNPQKMPVSDGLYIAIFLAVAYGIVRRIRG